MYSKLFCHFRKFVFHKLLVIQNRVFHRLQRVQYGWMAYHLKCLRKSSQINLRLTLTLLFSIKAFWQNIFITIFNYSIKFIEIFECRLIWTKYPTWHNGKFEYITFESWCTDWCTNFYIFYNLSILSLMLLDFQAIFKNNLEKTGQTKIFSSVKQFWPTKSKKILTVLWTNQHPSSEKNIEYSLTTSDNSVSWPVLFELHFAIISCMYFV